MLCVEGYVSSILSILLSVDKVERSLQHAWEGLGRSGCGDALSVDQPDECARVEARVDAPVGINGVCVLDGSRLAEILPLQQAMVLPDIGPCYSRSCIVDLPR